MNPTHSLVRYVAAAWLAATVLMLTPPLLTTSTAFEDAFDDGDDAGWTHFDPMAVVGLAAPSLFGFSDGVFRMEANPPAADPAGPARIFSFIDNEIYSDFYCAVDIVDWNDDINQAFGLLGRAANIGLGQTTGYVCNYDPNQTGGQPGGQFQINRIIDEASAPTIAVGNVKLLADHSYRMVFRGEGIRLIGALYDLEDLSQPLVQIETDGDLNPDATTFTEGRFGVFCFYRGDDLTEAHAKPVVVFDNFVILEANPAPDRLPGIDRGVPSAPQIISHLPRSNRAFHPAAEGLQFVLEPGPAAAALPVKLFLNDLEISGDKLASTETQGRFTYSYTGLEPNQIYEARVEVGGTLSRWWFDTFEEQLAETGEAVLVEIEDYNFGGGQFLDNPEASGTTVNGATLPNIESSYYDRLGVPEVDFHDSDTGPISENDYRSDDFTGLTAGLAEIDPGDLQSDQARSRHTLTGARDYILSRTEAGEWLNYTRTFPQGNYHVYLRAASRAAQNIQLDRVTSDATSPNQTTESLGTFDISNQGSLFTWRHTPLTDAEGAPLTLSLSGTSTLRLTMTGEENAFAFRRILALNYLLFVPVSQDDPNLIVTRSGIFETVVGATDKSLVIRNGGATKALTLTSATVEGEDKEHFSVVGFPSTLAPDESATLQVRFDPKGREGVFLAELVFTTTDASTPEIRVDLTTRLPPSSGLLVHYPFDETNGTIAIDASGNRRHGTYIGDGIQLGEADLAGGSAVRLRNTANTAYVEIPGAARLPALNAMTLSLWFREESGSNATILSKGLEPADPFAVAVGQGTLAWGAAGESLPQTELIAPVGETHHLVVRYDAGHVTIILNGTAVIDTDGDRYDDSIPSALRIGALPGGVLGFSGVIDDFQLYQRVLSDEEVRFLNRNPGQPISSGGNGPGPSEAPPIITLIPNQIGGYRLQIVGNAVRTYSLETSPNMAPDSWNVLQEVPADTPTIEIDLKREGAVQFYRLRY